MPCQERTSPPRRLTLPQSPPCRVPQVKPIPQRIDHLRISRENPIARPRRRKNRVEGPKISLPIKPPQRLLETLARVLIPRRTGPFTWPRDAGGSGGNERFAAIALERDPADA